MKKLTGIVFVLCLTGCIYSYEPPTAGPTATLIVEPEVEAGVPLISSTTLSLWVDEVLDEKVAPGSQYNKRAKVFAQKIKLQESNTFIIPADTTLDINLRYSFVQLSAPTLSGSKSFVFSPKEGETFVAKFWTDKDSYSVHLYEVAENGELVAANAKVDTAF